MHVPREGARADGVQDDAYGLDEPMAPLRPVARFEEPPGLDDAPPNEHGAKRADPRQPTLVRRLLDVVPRGDDLQMPIVGAVSLVIAAVALGMGGHFAQSVFVALALGAPICLLWGGIWALLTSMRRGIDGFLPLFVGVTATFVLDCLLAASRPPVGGLLAAGLGALGGYLAFLGREKHCHLYRRPAAVGVLGTLLFASFLMMLHAVRRNVSPLDDLQRAASAPAAAGGPRHPPDSLPVARRGFRTKLVRRDSDRRPVPIAPPDVFRTIQFHSHVGPLAAYLTPDPGDGARHPAIVWVTGGDSNTIDEGLWSEPDPQNDQTASAYRKAGVVLMFPSLRGGNENPGAKEGFLGEVDDILLATDFLSREPYVDPARIYLGGHSTGGTLVLLTAASTDRYRAVFAFGPVHDVRGYDPQYLPFDTSDPKEAALRAPALWLHSIRCPTFVIEGTEQGNLASLNAMRARSKNPLVHFVPVQGADHFSVLAPVNRLIAEKILNDTDASPSLSLTAAELDRLFGR